MKTGAFDKFNIYLSTPNQDLVKMITTFSSINMVGYTQDTDYSYYFTNDNDASNIQLNLIYLKSMNNPKLIVNFDLPSNFLQSLSEEILIVNSQMSLNDIIVLSDAEKALGKSSKDFTEAARLITIVSIIVSSALAKTFGAVQTLMLVNLVFYLKYINIQYPPHMQDLFDTDEFSLPFFIFNYNNPDQLILPAPPIISTNYYQDCKYSDDDVFIKYKIRLNFVDNFGDKMIQFIIVYVFSLCIIKLRKKKKLHPKVGKIVGMLYDFLCWGWILNFFLTNFRNIFIFIFRSWYYNKFETPIAKFDLFITIIVFIIMIVSFFHLLNVNFVIIVVKKTKKKEEKDQISGKISGKLITETEQPLATKKGAAIETLMTENKEVDNIISPSKTYQNEVFSPKDAEETNIQLNKQEKKQLYIRSSKMLKVYKVIYKADETYDKKYLNMNADYKKEDKKTINYVLLFMSRFGAYSLIIVVLRNVPFLQIFLIEYINVLFLCYIIWSRPFESKLKFVFTLLQEIVVIYIMFYPLVLAAHDLTGRMDEQTKVQIGDYFLKSYLMFTVVIMVTVILGIIITAIENAIEKKKNARKKKMEEELKNKENNKTVLNFLH